MSGVPVIEPSLDQPRRRTVSPKHRRRLQIHRAILSLLILGLSVWLVGAAQSATSGPIERALMYLIAVLLPVHLVVFQLEGVRLLDRIRDWPKPLIKTIALLMLAASPMVLYPLGVIALLVAIFSGGGAAGPVLTVTGLLMLSPIIVLILIALMFIASGYKGG
jgi:hypothetical protein